ncbi:hypothetical protein [Leptolyngbya sp. FACHB-261]|uniref:hypothetical protein n=1 Tax=Leptolyngbya sp. FACHB-261 TaxID=2692806 RepID=UPI001682382C|nr:hypothetical protein [Leptolyngbya sp. FACHB-261]MBD2103558.1 hypothetical protein [Leptolyngbya sp. FACHB-261]
MTFGSSAAIAQQTPLEQLTTQILNQGCMSRTEYGELSSALATERELTAGERRQIHRVFDYLQTGRLQVE